MRAEITIDHLVLDSHVNFSDPALRAALGDALIAGIQSSSPRLIHDPGALAQTVDDLVARIASAASTRLR